MLTLLSQAVAPVADTVSSVAAPAVDTLLQAVQMSDSELIALGRDPMFALQKALYTWLLTGIIGFGVAIIMKFLYLHIKSARAKEGLDQQ